MNLVKILVDELPDNCASCNFIIERHHCKLKAITLEGNAFVSLTFKERDKDCPLTLFKKKDDTFGGTEWSIEELKQIMIKNDVDPSDANVDYFIERGGEKRLIDSMTDAGWSAMDTLVKDIFLHEDF
jgi:hypothetical protein